MISLQAQWYNTRGSFVGDVVYQEFQVDYFLEGSSMPLSALEDEDAVFFVQFDNLARPSAYQYVIVTPVVYII